MRRRETERVKVRGEGNDVIPFADTTVHSVLQSLTQCQLDE